MKKIILNEMPFRPKKLPLCFEHGRWSAHWIRPKNCPEQCAFICVNTFSVKKAQTVRCHVTADSVYSIELDGTVCGFGPEQGDLRHYYFDSYDMKLSAGTHTLTARVFHAGDLDAMSRVTGEPGFLFAAEGKLSEILDTNDRNWKTALLDGISLGCREWFVSAPLETDWNKFVPVPKKLSEPEILGFGLDGEMAPENKMTEHLLLPATLPEQYCGEIHDTEAVYVSASDDPFCTEKQNLTKECTVWQEVLAGGTLTIPANTVRSILFRFDNYYCGNIELHTSGGKNGTIEAAWAEALYSGQNKKGDRIKDNREEFFGKEFKSINIDRMICGGGKEEYLLTLPCVYRSGRYCRLLIHTADKPLQIKSLKFRELRYPIEMQGKFQVSDQRFNAVIRPAVRTLQMCMHDTYMDCPYYEQLMYLGDTRLQLLVNYMISPDRAMADKAVSIMAGGISPDRGILYSRYPTRQLQEIPTFSLIFAGTVRDYILYRGKPEITAALLPLIRMVIDTFERHLNEDGLLRMPYGWNFVDWIARWRHGTRAGDPPNAVNAVSGVLNALYLYGLSMTAQAHELADRKEYAAIYRNRGAEQAQRFVKAFYRSKRGLFSDLPVDADKDEFSEHTQLFALLSGFLPKKLENKIADKLFKGGKDLAQATVYFSFYYMEACCRFHRMDKFMDRMKIWFDMDNLGLKTLLEHPEPSRSDCHAWSSHVLYHYYSTILGLRPASRGFNDLVIEPQLMDLTELDAVLPHPAGKLEFHYSNAESAWRINIPSGVNATMKFEKTQVILKEGKNFIRQKNKNV